MQYGVLRRLVRLTIKSLAIVSLLSAASLGNTLEMYPLSPPRVTATPSELITHVLHIENLLTDSVTVAFDIRMPPGWTHLGLPPALTLGPSTGEVLFVTLLVPPGFSGKERVAVLAYLGDQQVAAATLEVEAEQVSAAQMTVSGPEEGLAGQKVTYQVHLVNGGNRADTYVVSAFSLRGWPVTVEPRAVYLRPGEVGEVEVHVVVPKKGLGTDYVTVSAVPEARAEVVASERVALRILGELAQSEPLVAVLPARIDLRYAADRHELALDFLTGGRIDTGFLRGINLQVETANGAVRGLDFGLQGATWDLTAGQIAPRWAGPVHLDGHGVELRFGGEGYALQAAGVFGQGASAQIAYRAGSLELRAGGSHGTLADGKTGAQVGQKGHAARFEFAYQGDSGFYLDGGITRLGVAGVNLQDRSLTTSGYLGHNFVSGSVLYTDAGIPGRRGRKALAASWYRPLGEGASLNARVSFSDLFASEGRDRTWRQQMGVSGRLASGAFVSMRQRSDWEWRAGILERAAVRLEGTVRTAPGGETRPLSATLGLERNLLSDEGAPDWSLSARVTQPASLGAINMSLTSSGRIAWRSDGTAAYGLTASANATFSQTDGGLWRINAAAAYDLPEATFQPRVSVAYERQLTPELYFNGQFAWQNEDKQSETRLSVGLRYFFALPTPIPVRGRVEGVLVSADAVDVAGRIVALGQHFAVTDARGRFVFPSLPPGTYQLEVVDLPAQARFDPQSAQVTVAAGRTTELRVELAATGAVYGGVRIDPSTVAWGETPALAGLRIRLYQDGTLLAETKTGPDGRFSFWELAAGEYSVILETADLPPNTTLQKAEESVSIQGGERAKVGFVLALPPPAIDMMPLAPSASFKHSPAEPRAGAQVTFTSQSIVDWSRSISRLIWDMGDGNTEEGPQVAYVFTEPGLYAVRLTVIDSAGESDVAEQIIRVLPGSQDPDLP